MSFECEHFVFAKPVVMDQGVATEGGFGVVAASAGLSASLMTALQRELAIGSQLAIVKDLNSFLVCGPLADGRHVVAHYLPSPEAPTGRTHYEFLHCALPRLEQGAEAWVLCDMIRDDLSADVHRTYVVRRHGQEPQPLPRLATPSRATAEQGLSHARHWLSDHPEQFLLLVDAVAECAAVNVVGFVGTTQERASLWGALLFLLPSDYGRVLSLGTQVFSRPDLCPAKLRILDREAVVSREATTESVVMSWSRSSMTPGVPLTHAVSKAFRALDCDLRRWRDLVCTTRVPPPETDRSGGAVVPRPSRWNLAATEELSRIGERRMERSAVDTVAIEPAVARPERGVGEPLVAGSAESDDPIATKIFLETIAGRLLADAPEERRFLAMVSDSRLPRTVAHIDQLLLELAPPALHIYRSALKKALLAGHLACPTKVYFDFVMRELEYLLDHIRDLELVQPGRLADGLHGYPELVKLGDLCRTCAQHLAPKGLFRRQEGIVALLEEVARSARKSRRVRPS